MVRDIESKLVFSEESVIYLSWSLIMAIFLIANLVTIPFEIISEPLIDNNHY